MVKLESKKYPVESEMKDGKPVENYLKSMRQIKEK